MPTAAVTVDCECHQPVQAAHDTTVIKKTQQHGLKITAMHMMTRIYLGQDLLGTAMSDAAQHAPCGLPTCTWLLHTLGRHSETRSMSALQMTQGQDFGSYVVYCKLLDEPQTDAWPHVSLCPAVLLLLPAAWPCLLLLLWLFWRLLKLIALRHEQPQGQH